MKSRTNHDHDTANFRKTETLCVLAILKVGPYIYTEYLRLLPDEIKERFQTWIRNDNEILRASVSRDGKNFSPIYSIEDIYTLCKENQNATPRNKTLDKKH